MASRIIINKNNRVNIWKAIQKASQNASRIDFAVSYVRQSGWQLIDRLLGPNKIAYSKARVLLTDQMMITQPSSLSSPIEKGVSFWKYDGSLTYHPKVYLFYNSKDEPFGAIVGSGNISRYDLRR